MGKMLLGLVAASSAAFSALGPAGIGTTAAASPARDTATSVRLAWRANVTQPGCRVEMRWRRDYSGKPYLNKIRICA